MEVTIEKYGGRKYTINTNHCKYKYVVDWGDGCIEKSKRSHLYNNEGTYILRIKGHITFTGDKANHGVFDEKHTTKAL